MNLWSTFRSKLSSHQKVDLMNQETYEVIPVNKFPKSFFQLFSNAKITDGCEGLVVFLHSCMLEVGFRPKDVSESDVDKRMPANWSYSGISNILYYHKTIRDVTCRMTCVPLCSNLVIHGTIENSGNDDSVYLKKQVIAKGNALVPSNLFPCPEELSIFFKDQFCYPLLALIEKFVNCRPSFGLGGLVEEAKFFILKKLPVESVVSLSAVNRDFYNQAKDSHLWKFLYFRDYGRDKLADIPSSSEKNWKDMYKEEYLRRKRLSRVPFPRYRPYHLPQLFPLGPDFNPLDPDYRGIDPRIDLDPAIQQQFPYLRSRYHPSNPWFPPGPNWFW